MKLVSNLVWISSDFKRLTFMSLNEITFFLRMLGMLWNIMLNSQMKPSTDPECGR